MCLTIACDFQINQETPSLSIYVSSVDLRPIAPIQPSTPNPQSPLPISPSCLNPCTLDLLDAGKAALGDSTKDAVLNPIEGGSPKGGIEAVAPKTGVCRGVCRGVR